MKKALLIPAALVTLATYASAHPSHDGETIGSAFLHTISSADHLIAFVAIIAIAAVLIGKFAFSNKGNK